MKIKSLLCGLAICSFAGVSYAQTTVIELTGATAFRTAAVNSIDAAFGAGVTKGYANTNSSGESVSFTSSTHQIWKGTFPGITGTTVVRASWNGSVEGIRAVAVPGVDPVTGDQNNPLYIKEAALGANGTTTGVALHNDPTGAGAPANALNYERAESDMTFSDVAQSATPVSGLNLTGGPVGVVVFTMIANKTWADDKRANDALSARLPTSITAQQFRSLAGNGYLPLSFFTGNAADTTRVFLIGRNDGSGTRTSYLSETGVGAATPIRQYAGYDRSQAGVLPSIFLIPANGGFNAQNVAQLSYRSTVWGNNRDGNGGYSSSGDVRSDLAKSTAATSAHEFVDLDESGDVTANEVQPQFPASKVYLLSWITYSDARSARGAALASARTAEILGYDGVRLEGLAGDNPPTNLAGDDLAKVTSGAYTAWNFQQLYYVSTRPGTATVFNELSTRLDNPAVIGTAGLPLGAMKVNRTVDGGVILPN